MNRLDIKISIMPLMGRSVCRVTTPNGDHIAIGPNHKEAWKAGMAMVKVALEACLPQLAIPDPLAEPASDSDVAAVAMTVPASMWPVLEDGTSWEDLIEQVKGSLIEKKCQCPRCKVRRGEISGSRPH